MKPLESVEEQIFSSFEKLLVQFSFSDVTVKMITNDCGISRMTFYRYFQDKYEIPRWYYESILNSIGEEWRKAPFPRIELTTRFLERINEKRVFFVKVLSYSGQNALSDYIAENIAIYCRHRIASHAPVNALKNENEPISEEMMLSIKMYSAGIYWIIYNWLNSDNDFSVKKIAEILCNNMPYPLAVFFADDNE